MPTHSLWAKFEPEFAHEIFTCAHESNRKLYRKALELLAPHMGMRPAKVKEMPKLERHIFWAELLRRPSFEVFSFNFLSHWLVEKHATLLCVWLDALGIAHDEKGCAESFPPAPPTDQLRAIISDLVTRFDPKIVSIYLRTFNEIDSVHWKELDQAIAAEPKLTL